ncbi:aldehyde dehydrogenase family protein [Rhodococcus sp. NPDC057014]|uniref:aldehyde dehydrogenase family protein n=1 Tax=Rhodococcus sp. NPDC057014 TaxID=3346000 RepID=UPI003644103B
MTTTMHTTWDRDSILVGGNWIPVTEYTLVHDPATESVIGRSASAGVDHVDAAVAAARAAGTVWGARTPEDRAKLLEELCDRLRARRQLLVDTTVAEVGAPVTVAEEAHIDLGIEILASYARLARDLPFQERLGRTLLLRRPAGVVACITPWNYPFYQLVAKVGAALAAGCTTVVKPAELTPLSTYLFADAVLDAGLPPGVVNLVPGRGRTVGAALAAHPGVDVVSFTGSTAVGRAVAHSAAESLTRACLELGGKSASVVLGDAPLPEAVTATVDAAMLNSGQTCSAWTRLLVPRACYEEAVALAADHAGALRVGDPRDRSTQLGPVISAAQRRSIAESVDAAVAGGARLAAGGTGVPAGLETGHYLRPTVLADVGPRDPIVREEIFGPVLVVLPHDGDDDAVRLANDSDYGLGGAVWSADPDRALGVAARMDTGQVDVNGAPFNPEAPFGGWKSSGLGRELGRFGVEEFTELTAVQR